MLVKFSHDVIVTGEAPPLTQRRGATPPPLQVTGDITLHNGMPDVAMPDVTPPPNPYYNPQTFIKPVTVTNPNATPDAGFFGDTNLSTFAHPPRLDTTLFLVIISMKPLLHQPHTCAATHMAWGNRFDDGGGSRLGSIRL